MKWHGWTFKMRKIADRPFEQIGICFPECVEPVSIYKPGGIAVFCIELSEQFFYILILVINT